MKRIAILMFQVHNNLGGILPSTINLCAGLEEAGYEPRVFHAEWREHITGMEGRIERTNGAGYGLRHWISGDRAHLVGDSKHAHPYKGKKAANELKERLSEYDGVILATSIPSYVAKGMKGNKDWKTVLKHGKPMIGIVRDCHWLRLSPHILPMRHRFLALAGVHPAAYYSLKNFPGRIACQVNPFDISKADEDYEKDWEKVCVTSWFKKWKRMDDGIRAAPFMKPIHLYIAGGGLELSYMLAEKTEEEYTGRNWEGYHRKVMNYRWKPEDSSYRRNHGWKNKSIFRVAEQEGNFHYVGFKLGRSIEKLQESSGGLVDFSYHYKWGEHFNRVLIEAMLVKSIPFARPYGISDNEAGHGKIFDNTNVVLIPEDSSPKRTGEIIRDAMQDHTLRSGIVKNNLRKLEIFDRETVAKNYVRLLEGRQDIGLFGVTEGRADRKVISMMERFDAIRRFPRLKE
jgi:hypothetical protein